MELGNNVEPTNNGGQPDGINPQPQQENPQPQNDNLINNQPDGETKTPPEQKEENIDPKVNDNPNTPPTPGVSQEEYEKLKSRLQEYELSDAEINQLKARLGVDNVDYSSQQISQTLDAIQNSSQQEYIRLCTKFGVDYRPDKIDESAKALLERDPKAYYELQYGMRELYNSTEAKKQEVHNLMASREVNSFYQDNKLVFDSSPVITSVINDYINSTPVEYLNRTNLNALLDRTKQIYAEAFNAGMQVGKAQEDINPNKILNNSIMNNNQSSYPISNTTFTRQQIANMSIDEFKKNEKAIMQQMAKGLI